MEVESCGCEPQALGVLIELWLLTLDTFSFSLILPFFSFPLFLPSFPSFLLLFPVLLINRAVGNTKAMSVSTKCHYLYFVSTVHCLGLHAWGASVEGAQQRLGCWYYWITVEFIHCCPCHFEFSFFYLWECLYSFKELCLYTHFLSLSLFLHRQFIALICHQYHLLSWMWRWFFLQGFPLQN